MVFAKDDKGRLKEENDKMFESRLRILDINNSKNTWDRLLRLCDPLEHMLSDRKDLLADAFEG